MQTQTEIEARLYYQNIYPSQCWDCTMMNPCITADSKYNTIVLPPERLRMTNVM